MEISTHISNIKRKYILKKPFVSKTIGSSFDIDKSFKQIIHFLSLF